MDKSCISISHHNQIFAEDMYNGDNKENIGPILNINKKRKSNKIKKSLCTKRRSNA